MSFRVDVIFCECEYTSHGRPIFHESDYTFNKIRFATREEADKGGILSFERAGVKGFRIVDTNDPVNFQMLSTLLPRDKMTLEHARELLGKEGVPTDPYCHKFFLESLDHEIYLHGEEWVKQHATMLNSQWEYVKTLL